MHSSTPNLRHDIDGYYVAKSFVKAKPTYPMGYIPKIQEYSDALADAAFNGNLRAIGRAKASLDYFYDQEITRMRGQIQLLEQNAW